MSTTHLPLPRPCALALPLLGGPFHGEKYHAAAPPPMLRLTAPDTGRVEFYLLRTTPGDIATQSAAYVLESLDADTTRAWLDAWRNIALTLPDAWQEHALRRLLMPRVACQGCGRCSGVYGAHSTAQPDGLAFHCLDCGELRATLTACPRNAHAGAHVLALESPV